MASRLTIRDVRIEPARAKNARLSTEYVLDWKWREYGDRKLQTRLTDCCMARTYYFEPHISPEGKWVLSSIIHFGPEIGTTRIMQQEFDRNVGIGARWPQKPETAFHDEEVRMATLVRRRYIADQRRARIDGEQLKGWVSKDTREPIYQRTIAGLDFSFHIYSYGDYVYINAWLSDPEMLVATWAPEQKSRLVQSALEHSARFRDFVLQGHGTKLFKIMNRLGQLALARAKKAQIEGEQLKGLSASLPDRMTYWMCWRCDQKNSYISVEGERPCMYCGAHRRGKKPAVVASSVFASGPYGTWKLRYYADNVGMVESDKKKLLRDCNLMSKAAFVATRQNESDVHLRWVTFGANSAAFGGCGLPRNVHDAVVDFARRMFTARDAEGEQLKSAPQRKRLWELR